MKILNRTSKLFIFSLLISSVFAQSGRDMTGTEVSAVAFRSMDDPYTVVEFTVNVVSADYNWADGVRFTFPESVDILNAFVATELDSPAAIIISDNEVLLEKLAMVFLMDMVRFMLEMSMYLLCILMPLHRCL